MKSASWLLIAFTLGLLGCTRGPVQTAVTTSPVETVSSVRTIGSEESGSVPSNSAEAPTRGNSASRDIEFKPSGATMTSSLSVDEDRFETEQEPNPTGDDVVSHDAGPLIEPRSRVKLLDTTVLPNHPFSGIIQLKWSRDPSSGVEGWYLWHHQWIDSGVARGWSVGRVPLPEFSIRCLGDVGLVSHGAGGIEIGGTPESASSSFLVPWGGSPQRLETPSAALLDEIRLRPSNVEVRTTGDYMDVNSEDEHIRYALREPARADGVWWQAQARHDGDVFVITVHPARHECLSGVTWVSVAGTGEVLACGADTAATRYVSSGSRPTGHLILPAADQMPDYFACGRPLNYQMLGDGSPR